MRNVVSSFDKYPFKIPAITSLSSLHLHPDVTFIVGENGSGKSTLTEALVAIDQLVQKQSQLLAYPNAVIYQLDENGLTKMAYQETAQYQVTKGFLDDYKRMLSILLDRLI